MPATIKYGIRIQIGRSGGNARYTEVKIDSQAMIEPRISRIPKALRLRWVMCGNAAIAGMVNREYHSLPPTDTGKLP